MTAKYNVGDIVRVIDNGCGYSRYKKWFSVTNNERFHKHFHYGKEVANGEICEVMATGEHELMGRMIYCIKPINKTQVYLIGEAGIELEGRG